MPRTPTVDEAIERARQSQEQRIAAIRDLAEARQQVTDVAADADRQRAALEERLGALQRDAESTDKNAYRLAIKAGWSTDELRDIGFAEPDTKRRSRRRSGGRPKAAARQSSENTPSTSGDAVETESTP